LIGLRFLPGEFIFALREPTLLLLLLLPLLVLLLLLLGSIGVLLGCRRGLSGAPPPALPLPLLLPLIPPVTGGDRFLGPCDLLFPCELTDRSPTDDDDDDTNGGGFRMGDAGGLRFMPVLLLLFVVAVVVIIMVRRTGDRGTGETAAPADAPPGVARKNDDVGVDGAVVATVSPAREPDMEPPQVMDCWLSDMDSSHAISPPAGWCCFCCGCFVRGGPPFGLCTRFC
jgi:hypothetical protein